MTDRTRTKQLILEAVVACIEKYGIENVTTRRIAHEAGTNIASINYHFRSKDDLINQTLSMTINHMLEDVMVELGDGEKPFETTLQEVFRYILEGSATYPGISKAHLGLAISAGGRETASARAMTRVFKGLLARARKAFPKKDPEVLRLRLGQVMYSLLFTFLAPRFFGPAGPRARRARGFRDDARDFATLFLRSI